MFEIEFDDLNALFPGRDVPTSLRSRGERGGRRRGRRRSNEIRCWRRDALVACSALLYFLFHGIFKPMHPEHRHLAHLQSFSRHPTVFLTVVTDHRRPLLTCHDAYAVLVNVWNESPMTDGWFVGRFTLMPDHVHLFARPAMDAKPLSNWIQTWKSLSSRQIITLLRASPPIWQKDYFDRFLRSADSYQEKWNYVEMNPVRKGLCSRPAEWPWQGELTELRF